MPDPTTTRRRPLAGGLFRFSLRTMLLFIVACSFLLGIWTVYVQPFRDQKQAWDRFAEAGGKVELRRADGSAWQEWLVKTMVDENAYVSVLSVDLRASRADDEILRLIRYAPQLRQLWADGIEANPESIAGLRRCPELRLLSLRHTPLGDEIADVIASLPHLEKVYLTGTQISDDGIRQLSKVPTLQEVFARWTPVTESAAAELEENRPGCKVHFHTISE